jgi:hypothetical protein
MESIELYIAASSAVECRCMTRCISCCKGISCAIYIGTFICKCIDLLKVSRKGTIAGSIVVECLTVVGSGSATSVQSSATLDHVKSGHSKQ